MTLTILVLLSLSADDTLPEAKEKATVIKMCASCHPVDRIVKTRFSKNFWTSTVDDMVSRGAEGTEEEAGQVISYLTRHFGKAVNINTATAKAIQFGLSFKPAEAELIVRLRTEKGPLKDFDELTKIEGLNPKILEEQKNNIQF